jgi:hypothetical protein
MNEVKRIICLHTERNPETLIVETCTSAGLPRLTRGFKCKIVENPAGVSGAGPHAAIVPQVRVNREYSCLAGRRNTTFIR